MSDAISDLRRDAADLSVEQMEREHVARFAEADFYWDQFLDTKVPGHNRSQANVIGAFSNRASAAAKITSPHNFFAGYMLLPPGSRGALHNHKTAEVFVPLQGRMRLFWGENGGRSIELGPFDMISVPPGVFRGFENIGDCDLLLLGILEGPDPGQVAWSPDIEAQAKRLGYEIGSNGFMQRLDGGEDTVARHRMRLASAPEVVRAANEA
jgi:mannose-6-phosphate isomerase-like protein (cupin superfamily)